jgi:hypothetical protein
MADALKDVIRQLEQQGKAIETALAALREVADAGTDERSAPEPSVVKRGRPAKRKGGMSPEGKQRLIAALKKRWAAKKAAQSSAPPAIPSETRPARTKPRFSAEGRKRLAEAMKRRWAAKRTATQAKKRPGRPAKGA